MYRVCQSKDCAFKNMYGYVKICVKNMCIVDMSVPKLRQKQDKIFWFYWVFTAIFQEKQ